MFFGTNRAFDTTSNVYVSNGLHQLGEHRKMLRWIGHILTNRKILVTTTEGQSQKHVLHEDISQGTLLSPVLFNAAVAQLHCPFIRFLHISIYDDDIWFLTFGSSQGSTKQKLNAGFFYIQIHPQKCGIYLSAMNCVFLPFTLKPMSALKLFLQGQDMES